MTGRFLARTFGVTLLSGMGVFLVGAGLWLTDGRGDLSTLCITLGVGCVVLAAFEKRLRGAELGPGGLKMTIAETVERAAAEGLSPKETAAAAVKAVSEVKDEIRARAPNPLNPPQLPFIPPEELAVIAERVAERVVADAAAGDD